MARKIPAAVLAAVSTDPFIAGSAIEEAHGVLAADTTTAQNGKPTRTRAPRSSRVKRGATVLVVDETPTPVEPIEIEPELPHYAASTEETVAAVQAEVTNITRPSMDVLMVFGNTEDPDAPMNRVVARFKLVSVFEALYAKSAELASMFGPGSAELNIATQAVVTLDADLNGIDIFDLETANPAITEAVETLADSIDVDDRAEARQTLRDRRNELVLAHDQAVSIGLDRYTEDVQKTIDLIEVAMAEHGFSERDSEAEEAALRAADEANVPVVVECPYQVIDLEGAPKGQTVVVLPEGQTMRVRFYPPLGRDPEVGSFETKRVETDDSRRFLITATEQVALLIKDLQTVKLPDGAITVLADGITAYIACANEDVAALAMIEVREVRSELLVRLKKRLGEDYVPVNVADTGFVLGFTGDVALIIAQRRSQKELPRLVVLTEGAYRAEVAELGESRALPPVTLGSVLDPDQKAQLADVGKSVSSTPTGSPNRNPTPKTPLRGRSADRPLTTTAAAEPTSSDQGESNQDQGQDRRPPTRPVQTTTKPPRSDSPVDRRLVNQADETLPGVRELFVPGELETRTPKLSMTTLVLDVGVQVYTYRYPSNVRNWADVEPLGPNNGYRLRVCNRVLVVVDSQQDYRGDDSNVVVDEVLFCREPVSRTLFRMATQTIRLVSAQAMRTLRGFSRRHYVLPNPQGKAQASREEDFVRVEEDELLAWALDVDTQSGETIMILAVTTVGDVVKAYTLTGVRCTVQPIVTVEID